MAWYVAASLNKLLSEVNQEFPNRDKTSDGSVGDTSHQARPSDHNPAKDSRPPGCVRARDFDNDTRTRQDMHAFIRSEVWFNKDRRIKYIISKGKIISYYPVGGYPAWAERPYHGANPHNAHVHISIRPGDVYEDDARPWLADEGDGFDMAEISDLERVVDERIDPVESALNDALARIKKLEKSVGPPFKAGQTLQKSLIIRTTDPETGQSDYLEHLSVIHGMCSEIINTLGELADAVKNHTHP